MKTKLLRIGFAASLSCLVVSTGCEQRKLDGNGDGEPHALLVRLTPDQWNQIQGVLNGNSPGQKQQREKLFRIREYYEGEITSEPYGTMSNDFLVGAIPNRIDNFTGYAVQIGLGADEDPSYEILPPPAGVPPPQPATGSAHRNKNLEVSREMLKAVKCILNSPTCTPTPTATP